MSKINGHYYQTLTFLPASLPHWFSPSFKNNWCYSDWNQLKPLSSLTATTFDVIFHILKYFL